MVRARVLVLKDGKFTDSFNICNLKKISKKETVQEVITYGESKEVPNFRSPSGEDHTIFTHFRTPPNFSQNLTIFFTENDKHLPHLAKFDQACNFFGKFGQHLRRFQSLPKFD